MIEVRDQAKGRWRAILPALGVDAKHLQNRGGPCPICKAGTDRFRFDDKDGFGSFYCNHCGAGDGIRLVELVNGWDFKKAAAEVRRQAGFAPLEVVKPRAMDDPARRKDMLNTLWQSGRKLEESPAVVAWWMDRCGQVPVCADLRATDKLRYDAGEAPPSWHPGMLARVRGPEGEPVAIHRTYLTEQGHKARLDSPRKLFGPLPKGSAVRLFPSAPRLGIAEGKETAFAASILFGLPVWAALTADNLAAWNPPAGVETVVIFGDEDVSCTGQAVAFALARRLLRAKTVQVEVKIPPAIPGRKTTDWDDVLMAQLAEPERQTA